MSFLIWIIFGSQDLDSNFYYFSVRFYDSKAGRFLSADPVVPEAQSNKGLSRYTYVYNNPIQFDDPDGHVPNDRSREVRTYEDALEDYETHLLADLGYFDSGGQDDQNDAGEAARVGQVAAFGIRESIRLNYAPITASGTGARLLHVARDAREASSMERVARRYRPSLAGQTTDTLQVGLTMHTRNRVRNLSLDEWLRNLNMTSSLEWREAKRLGLHAGASQTSILIPDWHVNTNLTDSIRKGFSQGAKIPMLFNVFGGLFGIVSSLQYENELAKSVGVLGGLGEVAAGVSWAKDSRLLLSSKGSNPTAVMARNAASMRLVGARALGFASGFVGLIALALEYAASQDHPPPSEEGLRYRELHPDVGSKKINGEPLDPCKGNYCLIEGTLVWTPEGFRRIEAMGVGDFVLSSVGQSRITRVSRNEVSSWLQIKTSQETLGLTANHPVKVENRGWILAGEIEIGDQLAQDLKVLEIQKIQTQVKVYNLQVEPLNEFYVGSLGILVGGICF